MDIDSKIVRRLALAEFNASHNVSFVQGVHAVRQKLNLSKLDNSMIEASFQRLQTAQLPPNKEENVSTEQFLFDLFVAYMDLKHMADWSQILITIKKTWRSSSVAQNGRLSAYSLTYGETISFIDHFCGEFRDFPIKNMPVSLRFKANVQIKFIHEKYILQVFEDTQQNYHLYLLELDIDNENVKYLDHTQFRSMSPYIYLDELDPTRFLMDHSDDKYCVRRIEEGKLSTETIVKSEYQLYLSKFVGNKVHGFRFYPTNQTPNGYVIELRYGEQDFLIQNNLMYDGKLPFNIVHDVNDSNAAVGATEKLMNACYHWSGDQFFLAEQNDNLFFVRMFDKEKQKWNSINVYGFGMARDMYLDGNGVLSIGCVRSENELQTFRFALRKPDTLKNITWFNIKRQEMLFKREICDRAKKCLPNDSEFIEILPEPTNYFRVGLRTGLCLDVYEIKVNSASRGINEIYTSFRVIVIFKKFLVVI